MNLLLSYCPTFFLRLKIHHFRGGEKTMTVFKGELQQQFSSSLFNSIYSFIPVQHKWSCDLRIQGKCSFSIWKYILWNPTLKIYRFRLNIGPRSLETELSLSPLSSSFSSSLVICWRSARPAMPPLLALPLPGRPPRRGKEMSLSCFLGVYYKLPNSDPNAVYLLPNAVYLLQCCFIAANIV